MKLSEAIVELEKAIKEHGDIELRYTDSYGQQYHVDCLSFGVGEDHTFCGGGDFAEFDG